MNQQPKEKPIVELLKDIHTHRDPQTRRGMLNPQKVDRAVFLISCACITIISFSFLAMIWDFVETTLGFRVIGSMFVLLLTMHVFRSMNEQVE